MALSELQLVIFGDSWTDGGYHGQGVGATGGPNDPMEEVFCGPIRKIGEHFGSKFHFKECLGGGFKDFLFSPLFGEGFHFD